MGETAARTATVRVVIPKARTRITLDVYESCDPVSMELRGFGVWQRPILGFLQDLLSPGSVYVDVGAHVGYFAVGMAKVVGETGRVIAFEPNPDNAVLLRRNAAANNANVDVRPVAVSSSCGTAILHTSIANRGGHSITGVPDGAAGAVTVQTTTLSVALSDVPRVHCVKIDVQGAELAVLEGLSSYLSDHPPPYIIFELNPTIWQADDPGFARLRHFIERHRYDVHLFAASIGMKAVPPRLEWPTFERLARDVAAFSHASTELDLLLAPAGYWEWALKRYQNS